jgi:hypothetical protein
MNRIAYIIGRLTIVLGALVTIAPAAAKLFHSTWG